MGDSERPRAARAWVELGLWVLLIFLTVPFVGGFQRWVARTIGSAAFGWAVVATVLGVGALLLGGPWRRQVPRSAWPWLAGVAVVYLAWTALLWSSTAETVHLVEYAVLGLLAFRALGQRGADWGVVASAALVGSLVGVTDEVVQWLTPNRVPDLRDMTINAGAASLVQLAIIRLVPGPLPRPDIRSLRRTLRLAAALAVLLALCLAATPARVNALVSRYPAIAFLARNPEPMCEYGYAYHDPEIGRFKSRFAAADLARLDAQRGTEVAAILDRYPEGRVAAFLREMPSGRDPFTHEARVHIHNRDFHLVQARAHAKDAVRLRDHATLAWREQRILERYFPTTMAASKKHQVKGWRLALMERNHDPTQDFVSKAGIRIVTRFSESGARLFLTVVAIALLGADLSLGWRSRPCPP